MFRILVAFHSMPHVKAYPTILFENLLPLLRNRIEVDIMWFVYRPKKLMLASTQEFYSSVIYMDDYKNAVEVIQKAKPDMIYCLPSYSPAEYAFLVASRALKIPTFTGELGNYFYKSSTKIIVLKSVLNQFFQNSIPGENTENQKKFMMRGLHYLHQYFFMIKTLCALKMSKLKILENVLSDIKRHLTMSPDEGSRFSCDINFVESEKTLERLVKQGFKRSSIKVVGNPTYDTLFQKLARLEPSSIANKKIKVLLVTKNPYDPGGHWTKKLQDSWLREVAIEFAKHKDEISLVVKIHPSGEILSEYESIIKPIEPSISIHQRGDILDFVKDSDVVIGTSTSTALVCSLIAKRPIIIWNVYKVKEDAFLERKLALECKDVTSIVPLIKQSLKSNPVSSSMINEFIKEYLYKSDGLATERISDVVLDVLKNRHRD